MDNSNSNGGGANSNGGGDNNANANAGNTNSNANTNANGAGGGDNTNANANGAGTDNQNAGGVTLTPEQLEAAFKHPRFKELNDKAKQADKLLADQEAANKKALEDQGKHKELADQYKAEAEQAKTALQTERTNNAIYAEAAKAGAHDPAVVAKLVDSGKITVTDEGTIEGVAEAVKALQTTNAYLFKTGTQKNVGGGDTNSAGNANTSEYAYSQYKDAAFYQAHQAEMDKALKEGRVDMTR